MSNQNAIFDSFQQAYDRQLPPSYEDEDFRELPPLGTCPYCRTKLTPTEDQPECPGCERRMKVLTTRIEELYDCSMSEKENRKRWMLPLDILTGWC